MKPMVVVSAWTVDGSSPVKAQAAVTNNKGRECFILIGLKMMEVMIGGAASEECAQAGIALESVALRFAKPAADGEVLEVFIHKFHVFETDVETPASVACGHEAQICGSLEAHFIKADGRMLGEVGAVKIGIWQEHAQRRLDL